MRAVCGKSKFAHSVKNSKNRIKDTLFETHSETLVRRLLLILRQDDFRSVRHAYEIFIDQFISNAVISEQHEFCYSFE